MAIQIEIESIIIVIAQGEISWITGMSPVTVRTGILSIIVEILQEICHQGTIPLIVVQIMAVNGHITKIGICKGIEIMSTEVQTMETEHLTEIKVTAIYRIQEHTMDALDALIAKELGMHRATGMQTVPEIIQITVEMIGYIKTQTKEDNFVNRKP